MAETDNSHNLRNRLLGRIHENDIHELCHVIQCCEDHSLLEQLYTLLFDSEKRVADNAAWLFTHLDAVHQGWLYPKCDELMQEAMSTSSETKRRLLLTLLAAQPLCEDNLRTDFLDFCMNQMISFRKLCRSPGAKHEAFLSSMQIISRASGRIQFRTRNAGRYLPVNSRPESCQKEQF